MLASISRNLGKCGPFFGQSAIYRLQSALLSAFVIFWVNSSSQAQPTYKLEVPAHIKPLATLALDGNKVKRSAVKDDPGFLLQYHIKKEGKSLATIEARSRQTIAVPAKEAGTYSVVLELFYPAYKGGNVQRGQFKPISNVLTYRLTPPAKPGAGAKIQLVEPPAPVAALVVQCGKGNGKAQEEKIDKGFAYKLLQGTNFDAWPKTAAKTHCWTDAKEVRFELSVPPHAGGTLRLLFVDGDGGQRKQKVVVQGKDRGEIQGFVGTGKTLTVILNPADLKTGKIEVGIQNLNPASNAVVSTVEFLLVRGP